MIKIVCNAPTSFYSLIAVQWIFSLPLQFLHDCVLNRVSVLDFRLCVSRVQCNVQQQYWYARDSGKSLKGINKIQLRDLCLTSVCSSAFSKLVLHSKCEELSNVILGNYLILNE